MTGFTATEGVQSALRHAHEEARALHHGYIGTEHILLGLLDEPEEIPTRVLTALTIDPAACGTGF